MLRGGRRRGVDMGGILLLMEVMRVGLDHIPPATMLMLVINCVIHYLDPFDKSTSDVCVSAFNVLHKAEYFRLITAAFFHLNDMHIYYNMSSLIYKGRTLEPQLGTKKFLVLNLLFALFSNVLYVTVGVILAKTNIMEQEFFTCAAGFSAVLFALKVVLQRNTPEGAQAHFMGIPMPSKYIYWAELLWIYVLVPGSSFVGHLCGIAVGWLYTMGYFDFLVEPLVGFLPDIDFQNMGGAGQEPGREQQQQQHEGGGHHDQDQQWHQQQRQNQHQQPPPQNFGGFGGFGGPLGGGGFGGRRRFVRDGVLY